MIEITDVSSGIVSWKCDATGCDNTREHYPGDLKAGYNGMIGVNLPSRPSYWTHIESDNGNRVYCSLHTVTFNVRTLFAKDKGRYRAIPYDEQESIVPKL